MYLGHHGFLLSYAVAPGTLLNVVGFHSTDSNAWEGDWFRLVTQEDYQKDFVGWGEKVQKLIKVSVGLDDFSSTVHSLTYQLVEQPDAWAMFNHPQVLTFLKGSLRLLGDAAHGTTPYYY